MKRLVCALALSLAPLSAAACNLALVLAIDISNSVDAAEFRVQTEGVADALLDPVVRESLVAGRMAVTVVFWSGPAGQYVVIPWRRLHNDADVIAMSEEARALRRSYAQSNTAIGAALAFSRRLFDDVPDCLRRTIDLSGDGQENAGTNASNERDLAHRAGITINALAIDKRGQPITRYFRNRIITPNGFVMTSEGHRSYAETLRRKMRREVAEATS